LFFPAMTSAGDTGGTVLGPMVAGAGRRATARGAALLAARTLI